MLPKDSPGVSIFPIAKIGQKIQPTAAITFENVEIDEKWRLGDLSLSDAAYSIMNLGRCVVCSNSLGLAQAALDDAAAFADSYYIDDNKIGSFQQIGLLLTKMQTMVFNMRAHTYNCASILEEAGDVKLAVSLMKYYVPQSAVKVADYAMQIFGGAGYSDSTRISRIWVDSRANQFETGTDQIMANTAAKEILKLYRS
jgi:alkylation response protein AidB-like acyl-CoA dehydrogenase